MRKIQFILFALVMIQFACEPKEDPVPVSHGRIDYNQVSDGFREMFEGAFSMAESLPLVSVVQRSQKEMTIKVEAAKISEASKDHFSGYFTNTKALTLKDYYSARPFSTSLNLEEELVTLNELIDTAQVFNKVQKMLVKGLSRELLVVNTHQDGYRIVSNFRGKVINSSDLSEPEKIQLLQLAAGSSALIQFFETGGMDLIRNNLTHRLGVDIPNGRTAGCSVDWRGVWIGAVGGALVNGSIGFYVGATAGTVTVPILGTATGAVGGAVFMGAIGFASAAIGGIATNLFQTCTRPGQTSLQQTFGSCESAWEAYLNNQIASIPDECFMVSVLIKDL